MLDEQLVAANEFVLGMSVALLRGLEKPPGGGLVLGRIMGLSPERIQELLKEESHRHELGSLKCDSIPVQLTRSLVEQALARDPSLTIADMARWLEMAQADFERAFIGKAKTGRPKNRVNVSSASRLMIALGRVPNELPGC